MDTNWTQAFFVTSTIIICGLGRLINGQKCVLPEFITRIYHYGKCGVVTKKSSRFEVPKSCFKHFYVFSASLSSITLALMISRYIYHGPVPNFVNSILDLQLSSQRQSLVTPESSLLATILVTLQCWKRLYETHCVSVFSDGKINVMQYVVGFGHYAGLLTCMIGESEGFVKGSYGVLHWDRLSILQYVCAIVFVLASYEQLKTNFILANLRKDNSGNVVTKEHKIPHGRLFEYISGPLQLTEIIMYAMLLIILWSRSTYCYVFLWVFLNQNETAVSTHIWYLNKFPTYPKQRKAWMPFLI